MARGLGYPLGLESGPCARRPTWGRSSVGRALAWHARGRRFDPVRLHLMMTAADAHARRRLAGVSDCGEPARVGPVDVANNRRPGPAHWGHAIA